MRRAAIVLCIVVVACNGEKHRLQERLTALEQQRAALARRLADRRNAMHEAEHRVDTLNADLTAYNTGVHAFITNHRIAAECIRASRSTWGDSNAFANDVSSLTKVGAALCAVGLLNADFAREVAHVTEKLGEADARVKTLNEQITAMQRTADAERSEAQRNENALDQLAADIADARRQLEH